MAKPRPYSRDHLRQECEVTEFFARHGIPVPRIVEHDRYGSFVIKERLAGGSLAVIYDGLGPRGSPRHERVREAVRAFVDRLLDLFVRHPEAKTSLSPNNIFVVERGDECELPACRHRAGAVPRLLAVRLRGVLGGCRPGEDREVPGGWVHLAARQAERRRGLPCES